MANRAELDTQKVSNDQLFWKVVQETLKAKMKLKTTCTLQLMRFYINFSRIFFHIWQFLCNMEEFECRELKNQLINQVQCCNVICYSCCSKSSINKPTFVITCSLNIYSICLIMALKYALTLPYSMLEGHL